MDDEDIHEEEEIPNEFECSLCLKLLLDPLSVSCGHTFCRQCINRSQEYRTACPMCRKTVHVGGGVNVLLASIIAERFPKALADRKNERAAELTAVETRPVATLPIVSVDEMVMPGKNLLIDVGENLAAYQAAIAGGHTLICRGPIINVVCTLDHLVDHHAMLKGMYRCNADNVADTDRGYQLGQAVEITDDPLAGEDLTDEESVLTALWSEAVELINGFLAKMGDSGRAAFFRTHGNIPRLQPGDCTAGSVIAASWWLCGVVVGPEERLLTTNTRARIESSVSILRESKNKLAAPFVMPGGTPWAIGGKQSLILLLIIILVAYLKYSGLIGGNGGSGRHYRTY
eukprot:GEMP01027819.1.p1 GENE.GEMP01027819.1~~GEMP01027819.1.p1  ORF type:complete len:344 (+),score=70.76 GEMP01027819.1:303-1334(+)